MAKMFKMQAAGIDVSIQHHTTDVPADGKYYLVRDGKIIDSFPTKNRAVTAFRKLLKELAYEPPDKPKPLTLEEILREQREDVEHYRSTLYWTHSSDYRSGGKGR